MSSSSNEDIVDCSDKEDNFIDWFDIEINQNINLNNNLNDNDFHLIDDIGDDIVDDYDLLNESSSNLSETKEIIYQNKLFIIDNKNQEDVQELKHIIIEIPESECFIETVQEPVEEPVEEPVQEPVQEQIQQIIDNQKDIKEYQNNLYNYLHIKYFYLLNRLNTINNYIFDRPYMHRFGNTITNLYNRVYFFFENNMNMIYNIGFYFGIYGFLRVGYNLIIRNQYRYIRNCIRNVRYYLYNIFT
jgi:hypothetical protein